MIIQQFEAVQEAADSFNRAYIKAVTTSQSADWLDAACLGR
jgi:hypothetical protein